jgi:hypothetical protein
MTPGNIVGMALLNGLGIVALTDHNSVKNCPAFFKLAKANGIIPVAGVELTTVEDVHVVCLFRTLEAAMAFGEVIEERRMKIPNRPDIFGHQYIVNDEDEVCGEEPYLLINAVDLTLEEAFEQSKPVGASVIPRISTERPTASLRCWAISRPSRPIRPLSSMILPSSRIAAHAFPSCHKENWFGWRPPMHTI